MINIYRKKTQELSAFTRHPVRASIKPRRVNKPKTCPFKESRHEAAKRSTNEQERGWQVHVTAA